MRQGVARLGLGLGLGVFEVLLFKGPKRTFPINMGCFPHIIS